MHTLKLTIRRLTCVVVAALLLLGASPAAAFADTAGSPAASPSSSTCSPVAPAPTGIQHPTGADARMYSYNGCTGLWENQYYTWSPATQTASPKNPSTYICDQSTWTWLTYTVLYNAASQSYYQVPSHAAVLPAGATVDPGSLNPCAPQPPQLVANSTNSASDTNATGGNATTASIENQITANAGSGSALVTANTVAGSATSGSASAEATIINALQSSSSLAGGSVTTFTANINGDVQGDLVIDPSQLQPATSSNTLGDNGLTVSNQTNGQITNDVVLKANSGDASVTKNTTAGSATTGNATAVANVVNLLNSLVTSGKSFVGTININGNLHGNILVPQQLLDSLIASNAPSTTVTLDANQTNDLGITNTNNLSTTNNITSSAQSGSASVTNNTTAGSARTGGATTQVRVFNLTGSQVISANCLLVFVNVSGKWIGVIFNAPAGATAAALGSGVTTNAVNNVNVTNATNDSITNNIDVSATSGNALVDSNRQAGGATSGNANTAVNLLNINNSDFNVSGWFGILFINIFGDWYGSLAAYNPAIHTGGRGGGQQPARGSSYRPPVFQYVPKTEVSSAATGPNMSDLANKLAQNASNALGHLAKAEKVSASASGGISPQAIGGLIVAFGLLLFVGERVIASRQVRIG